MATERVYGFTTYPDGCKGPEHDFVKESELTSVQKDLLLGEAVHKFGLIFNGLPDELKIKFCASINNSF